MKMTKVSTTPIFVLLFVSEPATAHGDIAYFYIAIVGGMIFALVVSILTLYLTNRREIPMVMGLNIIIFFVAFYFMEDSEFIDKGDLITIYPSASSFVILIVALCLRNIDIDANRRRDQEIENERNDR